MLIHCDTLLHLKTPHLLEAPVFPINPRNNPGSEVTSNLNFLLASIERYHYIQIQTYSSSVYHISTSLHFPTPIVKLDWKGN